MAIAMALLYAFSVLVPSVALASSNTPEATHCLTQESDGVHGHQHGSASQGKENDLTHDQHETGDTHESSDAAGKSHPRSCCGIFCVTALAGAESIELVTPSSSIFHPPGLSSDLADRSPDRIIRPPIA